MCPQSAGGDIRPGWHTNKYCSLTRMMLDDAQQLQSNVWKNLKSTVSYFASVEEQRNYKKSVSFVHIPFELLAQWDEYSDLTKDRQKWFIDMLPMGVEEEILRFDASVEAFCASIENIDDNLPDIPKILELEGWNDLMVAAERLKNVLDTTEPR